MLQKQINGNSTKQMPLTEDTKLKQLAGSASKMTKRLEAEQVDADGQLLLKAADFLEQHKWRRNCLCNEFTGSYCILGALDRASGTHNLNTTAVMTSPHLSGAIKRLSSFLGLMPFYWNDVVCKSKSEAVKALRNAAKLK